MRNIEIKLNTIRTLIHESNKNRILAALQEIIDFEIAELDTTEYTEKECLENFCNNYPAKKFA